MPFGFNPEIPDYYYPDYSPHNTKEQYRGAPYMNDDYYPKKHKKKHKKKRKRDDYGSDYYYGQRPPYSAGPVPPYQGGQYQSQGPIPPYNEGQYQGFAPSQGQGQYGGPMPQYPPPGQYGGGSNPIGSLFSNAGPLMDIIKIIGPKLLGI